MNRDLRHFIGLLSSRGFHALTNLLFVALLTRVLGPNGLGSWAMVVAAGTLLNSFLLSWMHMSTVRFGREEWQIDNAITITWSAQQPYLLAGFIIACGLIFLDPTQWLEQYFHISDNLKLAVLLAFFWIWLSMEVQNFLQLRQAMLRLAVVPIIIDSLLIIILLLVVVLIKRALPEHVLITSLLVLSVMLWGAVFLRELNKMRIRCVWPSSEAFRKIFNYSWPLIPGFLVGYVSDWGDQILIRFFFTAREVGLFQAAYQFMFLMLGVTAPLGTVLLPRLIDMEILSSNKIKEFLIDAGPTIITLGLFLLIPVVSFAPLGFQLLTGSKFAEAVPVFLILCAAIPGSIISTFYGVLFSLQGRLWKRSVIYCGIMSALNVIISLILLPRIGIIGAAFATSFSCLVVQLLYLLDQQQYYNLSRIKNFVLFGVIVVFAVLQVLVGNGLIARLLMCLFSLTALVFLAKLYSLLSREWILRIFSGKLKRIGELILYITIPGDKNFNNA